MGTAFVALDGQALQEGSGALAPVRRRVADLAADLTRGGRLASLLLAPELPAPEPGELAAPTSDLIRWDTRSEVRRLLRAHPRLVHYVPASLLHAHDRDRVGMVAAAHWADAAVPRVVALDAEDMARLSDRSPRLEARLEWIRSSDLIELEAGLDPASVGLPVARSAQAGQTVARIDELAAAAVTPDLPLRIAVFGPFPPGGGGIGAYNARFVEALATGAGRGSDRIEVDAVTTTGFAWSPPEGVGRVHAESFGTDVRPASYDAVLYTVGNSDGHLATVEAALRAPGWLWLHEARLAAVATTALAPLDDPHFEAHLGRLLERAYPGRPPVAAARAAGRSHLALASAGVGLAGLLAERAVGLFVNSTAARHALMLDLPPLAWRPPISVLPPACPPVRPRHRERDPQVAVAFGVVSMGKRPDLLVDAAARAGCRLAFVGPCPDVLGMVIRDRAEARGIGDRVEVVGRVDDAGWWEWMARATVAVQMRDSGGGEMSAAVLDALSAGVPVLTNLASAADYPEGTVELLEHDSAPGAPEDAALAAAVSKLLGDQARRRSLSEAGKNFAAAHQMADLADAVVAVVAGRPN